MILFFTYRVSLRTWVEQGIADRETAVYRRLLPRLGRVSFVTYGARDAALEPALGGIRVLPRPEHLGMAAMSVLAPWLYRHEIRAAAVLKTNQASGAWTAVVAKWLFRKPLIVRCGYPWSFNYARESPRWWRRGLVRLLERLAVRTADRVVVTAAAAGEYLVREHGVDPARVRVVPNAIDVVRFAPDSAAARATGRVIFVGRLAPEKNLGALVEAVARVPGARLRLVGEGPERATLEAAARRAGAEVEFTGTVANDAVPRLLNDAAVFALPSQYEGQPKALLEAMACGLPVLGADVPGIREAVRHGDTGWLCAPDADGLAHALRALLGDARLRERLGRQARAAIEREHALESVVERELAVIAEIVAGHP
ncbi:MAG TPA: glycosyltransferase family 4 protein [Candidatus Limnocylindria bacterium]|nr:glycosyltransferase family 4 protein [Candidatus Limnocylindria bacterium]